VIVHVILLGNSARVEHGLLLPKAVGSWLLKPLLLQVQEIYLLMGDEGREVEVRSQRRPVLFLRQTRRMWGSVVKRMLMFSSSPGWRAQTASLPCPSPREKKGAGT
jgi:hypothetical protein